MIGLDLFCLVKYNWLMSNFILKVCYAKKVRKVRRKCRKVRKVRQKGRKVRTVRQKGRKSEDGETKV